MIHIWSIIRIFEPWPVKRIPTDITSSKDILPSKISCLICCDMFFFSIPYVYITPVIQSWTTGCHHVFFESHGDDDPTMVPDGSRYRSTWFLACWCRCQALGHRSLEFPFFLGYHGYPLVNCPMERSTMLFSWETHYFDWAIFKFAKC